MIINICKKLLNFKLDAIDDQVWQANLKQILRLEIQTSKLIEDVNYIRAILKLSKINKQANQIDIF
jgi:hypothetical protein